MAGIGKTLSIIVVLSVLLVPSVPSSAQDDPSPLRIPKVGAPEEHFYNAAGHKVKLTATAVPTEVTTDDWITYSLTVTNLLNAADVEKPSLKKLKDFEPFQVDESAALDPSADPAVADRRVFIYRLRPASTAVSLIPEIPFYYFDPKLVVDPEKPRQRFPRALSNAIPVTVKSRAKPPAAAAEPLDVPDFATTIATGPELWSPAARCCPGWVWALATVVPPLLAAGWVLAWRRLYPDAARLARLKRTRAVRQALAALAAARRPGGDVAAPIADAFAGYLHERFELPYFARTPREIADHLRSVNLPAGRIEAVSAFFRSCDAARFAPAHAAGPDLADEAERLIVALEGAA